MRTMTHQIKPDLMTLPVLGGAYRGSRKSLAQTLTHVIDWSGASKTLCGKIKIDHMADPFSVTPTQRTEPATCATCARRDPRVKAVG